LRTIKFTADAIPAESNYIDESIIFSNKSSKTLLLKLIKVRIVNIVSEQTHDSFLPIRMRRIKRWEFNSLRDSWGSLGSR
jgi:hypothetical protein